MKQPPEQLFAWMLDGEDSIMAVLMDGIWYPMVASDEARALKMTPRVKEVVNSAGKSAVLRCYKFEKIVGGVG